MCIKQKKGGEKNGCGREPDRGGGDEDFFCKCLASLRREKARISSLSLEEPLRGG